MPSINAAARTSLRDIVAERIRDGGFTKPVRVNTVSVGDNTYRVTLQPQAGTHWGEWAKMAIVQIINEKFVDVGGFPPRLSVYESGRIVFRWYR